MTDLIHSTPSDAYDLLEHAQREIVDEYVAYAIGVQHQKRQRIIHAVHLPIPNEYVRRSRGVLHKPLVLAAVAERIRRAAHDQDISPERIIREHAAIAHSRLSDVMEMGEFGVARVRSLEDIPEEVMGAVKSIKSIPGPYGMRTEVVMHDKQMSLKMMGELMGLQAPDQPPMLRDYVAPIIQEEDVQDAPEEAYIKELEAAPCAT